LIYNNTFFAQYQNFVQVFVACSTKTAIFVRVFYKPVNTLLLGEIGACSLKRNNFIY